MLTCPTQLAFDAEGIALLSTMSFVRNPVSPALPLPRASACPRHARTL